jgi:membrane protease YdiL (CAAX protease family)
MREQPVVRPPALNAYDPSRAWLAGLLIGLALMGPLRNLRGFFSVVPQLAVAVVIARRRNVPMRETFRLNPFHPKDLVFPACFALSLGSAESLLFMMISFATGGRLLDAADAVSPGLPGNTLLVTMLFAVVFVPLVEEFFFRGFFMSSMAELGLGWAVIFPSLFFATGHSPFGWPGAFVIAVVSSIFVLRTGSIAPAVAAHSAVNLLGTGLSLLAEAPGMAGPVACLTVQVAFVGMGFLFIREYKSLWASFRSYWADFRQSGVKDRLGYLLRHWSYKVILVLLIITICLYGFLIVCGRPLDIS